MAKSFGNRAKSSREMRRHQARVEARYAIETQNLSAIEKKNALFRNGITIADLEREYKKGAEDGRKIAEDFAFHTIYAAFLITMIDHHGMDMDEAVNLLREIDNQVVLCVEDEDLITEAYEKTGVQINWTDALERIEERTGTL